MCKLHNNNFIGSMRIINGLFRTCLLLIVNNFYGVSILNEILTQTSRLHILFQLRSDDNGKFRKKWNPVWIFYDWWHKFGYQGQELDLCDDGVDSTRGKGPTFMQAYNSVNFIELLRQLLSLHAILSPIHSSCSCCGSYDAHNTGAQSSKYSKIN